MSGELERKSQQRRIVLMLMASAFLVWQVPGMDFFNDVAGGKRGLASLLSAAGFLLWAGGLVFMLASGRGLTGTASAGTRAALEDELVRSNRNKAFVIGYVAALLAAGISFSLSLYLPMTATDAAHLVLIVTVVAPMYAFVALEHLNA